MIGTKKRIFLAVTGASGSLYGEMFLQFLLTLECRIYLVVSDVGKQVVRFELTKSSHIGSLARIVSGQLIGEEKDKIRVFSDHDFFAPIASGTSSPDAMVLLPCSMGTVARIASGMSYSLIERAGDVMLKQQKQIILCPRESPLSTLHLENLLSLAKMGVSIVPLMPGLYQKPQTVEDMIQFSVGKVCEALGLSHEFYQPWNQKRS
ncbi:MAG: UbiX family flavin prenyltransferase [Proteobacteria bacterium]|nr:UbiX family flavin prenyltransferase [Pseudomonadota bacterium]